MYDADDDLETPLLAEEGGEGDSCSDDESDDEEMTCGCPQTKQRGRRFPIAMGIVLFCVVPFVHGFLKGFIKERNRIIVAREGPASDMDLDVALHKKSTSEQVSQGLRNFESDLGTYDLTGDIIVEHMSFERAKADSSINSSVHADTSTSVFAATERGFPSFPSLDEPRHAQTE